MNSGVNRHRGEFDGRSFVVTGGASGIGLEIANRLCAEGALVSIGDVADSLDTLAARLGPRATVAYCDVADSAEVDALIQGAHQRCGRIDGVVNVAGVSGLPQLTADISDAEFDRVIAVNLKGTFYSMRSAIPLIQSSGGGSIVNISSIAADVVFPLQGAYSASKGAINSLTRTAAREYAPAGVRINAIQPGLIDTPMYRATATPETDQYIVSRTPAGRIGTPGDVASSVLYLLSESSTFVTGVTLRVDGGWVLG